ncbi:MAG: penicillin acylase family protein [Chitinophagaceae bacterium]|nr:penicillin acylase family protein [Chitinophagaceae bacterium]
MKYLLSLLLIAYFGAEAQINPGNITIARDSFGVPHIFAKTDPEVAYGLAWAHAEDDLKNIETMILYGKARLGSAIGKKGAQADYVVNLLRCRQLVDDQWNTLSLDFLALIKGYVDGLNAYARTHPGEVQYRASFPFNEKEYITAVVFSISIFCGLDKLLPQLFGNRVATIPGFTTQGSNAFAFHPSRTTTGEAMLTINAHQPVEGPTAFYEAHVQSEQGWNMLGGLFPGGCLIFHGTNENLGWAHTVNYQDKIDLFQLEMNPSDNNLYKFDGKWLSLESKKVKLHVKGIPVPVNRSVYWSKYGATVKTKQGVFSIRTPATMDIKALEQWYRMNKAKNYTEFYKALSMTSLPMFNIIYADRYDTIFYISNGKMPRRNPDSQYRWRSTVPGNTSATLWTEFKAVSELPQYLNPGSGFLFNTNHSPFLATDSLDNLQADQFDRNDGFETFHNNRSQRVNELLIGFDKIDYQTMKRIKYDQQFPQQLQFPYGIDSVMYINANDYPELKDVISNLQQWDRKALVNSKGAAVFLLVYNYLLAKLNGIAPRQVTIAEAVETFKYVHEHMMKNFGTTNLVLGDVQKLVRGDVELPASGLPDVLTAEYTIPYKKGLRKITTGDAYICFVRYPKNGLPFIESVNTFGASNKPGSPHYKDQMQMFLNHQTKPMTLDKEEVLRKAERIYQPGK